MSAYSFQNSDVAGCASSASVMQLTNLANVPFDNRGFLQAKNDCQPPLPMWPTHRARLYPLMDTTNDMYPVQPPNDLDRTTEIENWPRRVQAVQRQTAAPVSNPLQYRAPQTWAQHY